MYPLGRLSIVNTGLSVFKEPQISDSVLSCWLLFSVSWSVKPVMMKVLMLLSARYWSLVPPLPSSKEYSRVKQSLVA